MFNIFKKKPIVNKSSTFQDSFSRLQKVTILRIVIIIAKADGEVQHAELEYMAQIGSFLEIELDDPMFEEESSKGWEYVSSVLNTLSYSQKEWFSIVMHSAAMSDGNLNEHEINMILKVLGLISISEDEYINIIKKSEVLSRNLS